MDGHSRPSPGRNLARYASTLIFLTGRTEAENETKGFKLVAVDYIHKPFSPAVVSGARPNPPDAARGPRAARLPGADVSSWGTVELKGKGSVRMVEVTAMTPEHLDVSGL